MELVLFSKEAACRTETPNSAKTTKAIRQKKFMKDPDWGKTLVSLITSFLIRPKAGVVCGGASSRFNL
jgi:hypothetical protein